MRKSAKFIALATITLTVTTCYGPSPDFYEEPNTDLGYSQIQQIDQSNQTPDEDNIQQ